MRKEILKNHVKEVAIEVAGNEITSIRDKNISKKGVRAFKDGKIYSASFVGNIDDDELLSIALDNIDSSIPYDYDLPSVSENFSKSLLLDKQSEGDLYNEYEKSLCDLINSFPNFIFSGKANLSRVNKELTVDGKVLSLTYDQVEWYFIYKHKKSADMMDGYFGEGAIASFNIESHCKNYHKYLLAYDNIVSLEAGPTPVVFSTPSQLLGKILKSLRVDNYNKDIGIFKGKFGTKVLGDKFSLNDVSFDPSIGALNVFDSEGTIRNDYSLSLIENGVFKNKICDSRNAKKYGGKSTGNSHRNFDSSTILGFNTPCIESGERSIDEIVKELPRCIVVEMAAGGDFTDGGNYSTPVQAGYLLEYGVVVGRTPQITLTSSIDKMFGPDLIEIANGPYCMLDTNPGVFMNMNVLLN